MNRRNHLTDEQIEQYTTEGDSQTIRDRMLEEHIASCDACRTRVLEHGREQLGSLETSDIREAPMQDCPNEEVLRDFAMGVGSPETNELLAEHVADCRYCAPLLKLYLDAMDDNDPQRVLFQRHGGFHFINPLKSFSRLALVPKIAWAAALAAFTVVLVAKGPVVVDRYELYRADRIVAAAFQESRPNPMRVTWAPYADVDLKRSTRKVQISELPALAEAARIAGTKRVSSDPRWIRFRARVKLLADEPDAPQLLTTAAEKGLSDPNTEIDLAVAYFQQETRAAKESPANGNVPNLGESLELLIKVLKEPTLSQEQRIVALFDLAIVYEKMRFWDQAVATWDDYLRLDPVGPWHDEAQWHRDKARTTLPSAKPRAYREPGFFLHHRDDPAVLASLEDYQDIALRSWALIAVNDPNSEASRALSVLAELVEERHGDSWMKNFLHALGPADLPGIRALAAAVTANKQSQYTEARKQARKAAQFFLQSQNPPGSLRARFEELYANQRLLEEPVCLDEAGVISEELAYTSYRWLQIQANLERAVCHNFAMNFTAALTSLEAGRKGADHADFNGLRLRAQALEAGIWVFHDCNTTWQQVEAGLELYWQSPSAPLRLYEFYGAAKLCFEKKQLWHAAEALERRMITLLENDVDRNDENVALEITAHRALEQILREESDLKSAESQARLGIILLDRADKHTAKKYEVLIKLELADLQLDRGDTEAATATVRDAEAAMEDQDTAPDQDSARDQNGGPRRVLLNLLRVRGDIELSKRYTKEAEEDYEKALILVEEDLRRLKDENKRRQWLRETDDVYRGLVAVFLEQKREKEALQLWEWYQARPFAEGNGLEGRIRKLRWTDVEQTVLTQPVPSMSDTRLVYATTRDRLHIWKIGSAGMKVVSVPEKRKDLQRIIFQYLQKCARPPDAGFPVPVADDESKRLFSILIQPVIEDLHDSDSVIIDMDHALGRFPVESLKSQEGSYFGEKYPVTYSPGYIRENHLRKPFLQAPRSGLLLDAWDDKSELDALIDLFPNMTVKSDDSLTTADLSNSLKSSEMFVFIGHGESGSLILHNRRPLKAEDFPPRSLKSLQLAVLAGCSTGLSSDSTLDMGNLVEGFQSGGTPSVVASQWDVDSRATTNLMTLFYIHLKHGESPSRALYKARKEMIRSNEHPYYWAGFMLTGRAS